MEMACWDTLSKQPKGVITDMFIMKFDKHLNWNLLSANYDFTIDLLRHYMHRVSWSLILQRKLFPVSFLREAAPYFLPEDWQTISRHQQLSELFIHDYADYIDWEEVILYQDVSARFLSDHCQYTQSPPD